MTQEQIKNDYAVSKGYKDFDDLLINVINYETLSEQIKEVMKIYAMECLKLASENSTNIDNYGCSLGTLSLDEYRVQKSITNENNIIK